MIQTIWMKRRCILNMERSELPLRKNCEGYFTDGKGNILAKKSDSGFIIFPGGGIDENERIEEGMARETLEETGAAVRRLRGLGVVNLIWGSDWAKTEKQKKRYEQFKGDEMHFFSGEVKEFVKIEKEEEDSWKGNKFMSLTEVIEGIRSRLSAEKGNEYIKAQLRFLTKLKEEMEQK